jgi:hypothetical protein
VPVRVGGIRDSPVRLGGVQAAPPPDAPLIAITAPRDGERFCINDQDRAGWYHAVSFQATATDPGSRLLTYSWTDSVDGGVTLPASTSLSPTLRLYQTDNQPETIHDLTLTVSNGVTSASKEMRVYIMYLNWCVR